MAQVTLYLDEGTLKRVETAARREHKSLSRWVKERLESALHHAWPEGYFNLFGALKVEGTFRRPKQPAFSEDARRESL